MENTVEQPLSTEQLEFMYDYLCVLVACSCAENALFMNEVERALENSRKASPRHRASFRAAAILGKAA